MTLSYWNRQFQFTQVLPDFQDCLADMRARSAALAIDPAPLSYGPDPRQYVELWGTPAPGTVLPVFIHGGYWRALDAMMHRFVLPGLAGPGHAAVANLEYRLLPHVSLDEIVADALSGLRLLAAETGCRLTVVGHSAGGHLALMGALRLPDLVAAAAGISGLYDLTPLQWSFLREEVGVTPGSLAGHSPQALWTGRSAAHTLVAVGADETPEFHRQAQMFASTHGAQMHVVPGTHHMSVLNALADPNSPLCAQIRALTPS